MKRLVPIIFSEFLLYLNVFLILKVVNPLYFIEVFKSLVILNFKPFSLRLYNPL